MKEIKPPVEPGIRRPQLPPEVKHALDLREKDEQSPQKREGETFFESLPLIGSASLPIFSGHRLRFIGAIAATLIALTVLTLALVTLFGGGDGEAQPASERQEEGVGGEGGAQAPSAPEGATNDTVPTAPPPGTGGVPSGGESGGTGGVPSGGGGTGGSSLDPGICAWIPSLEFCASLDPGDPDDPVKIENDLERAL